jgi:TatD DNase family protein
VIDSHAHLTMFAPEERAAVLKRAGEAGVGRVLVPATGPGDLEDAVRIARDFAGRCVAAVGVHPHEASVLDAGLKRRVESLLDEEGVVAVGEIGLDYYYEHSPREEQKKALRWQLELARERGLPVVLHQRDAWEDFLAALDAVGGGRGVAHSFTGGASGVTAVIERGLFVGISGMVTFRRGDNIREAAAAVPAARLLLETDSPYLTPAPHRGKRNEPAFLTLVAERVASVRGTTRAVVESESDAAFAALFGR